MVSLVVYMLFKLGGAPNALNRSPLLPLAFPPLFDSQCVLLCGLLLLVFMYMPHHRTFYLYCSQNIFGQAVLKIADITIAIHKYIRS